MCCQELGDWRGRMGQQVDGFGAELTDLQVGASGGAPFAKGCAPSCRHLRSLQRLASARHVAAHLTFPTAAALSQAMLTTEMGALRSELQEVKARVRAQLEASSDAIGALHARGDAATRAALAPAAAAAERAPAPAQRV